MLDLPFLMELEMATIPKTPSFQNRAILLYRGFNGWQFYGMDWNHPFLVTGHFEEDPQLVISQYPDIFWDGAKVLDCENVDPSAYIPHLSRSPQLDISLPAGHILRLHQQDPLPYCPGKDMELRLFDAVALDIYLNLHASLDRIKSGSIVNGVVQWE